MFNGEEENLTNQLEAIDLEGVIFIGGNWRYITVYNRSIYLID